jgi:hypothetical protein
MHTRFHAHAIVQMSSAAGMIQNIPTPAATVPTPVAAAAFPAYQQPSKLEVPMPTTAPPLQPKVKLMATPTGKIVHPDEDLSLVGLVGVKSSNACVLQEERRASLPFYNKKGGGQHHYSAPPTATVSGECVVAFLNEKTKFYFYCATEHSTYKKWIKLPMINKGTHC